MRRPKIDREKLHELARKGASQGQMASAFGVSQAAVSKALKDLERETTRCLTVPPTSARKSAARVIENSINAAEQLLKINKNANELLDLVMAWQRGDDVALQILESQVYTVYLEKEPRILLQDGKKLGGSDRKKLKNLI